jgi:hypothetical protein
MEKEEEKDLRKNNKRKFYISVYSTISETILTKPVRVKLTTPSFKAYNV